MLNRGRNVWISLTAAVLAALLVYGVYQILIRQVELQKTVRVVAPNAFIQTGTQITADMLQLRTITEGAVQKGMMYKLEDVLGKEALMPLGTGEPILDWKVDRFHLLPQADEATFEIPKNYILSLAGGIRAGDRVIVYASGAGGTFRLLEREVMVASVKSSGNVEVDDPKGSHLLAQARDDKEKMYVSRRDANAAVDQLNLNLKEEEWIRIDDACRTKDNKLVIAFLMALPADSYVGGKP